MSTADRFRLRLLRLMVGLAALVLWSPSDRAFAGPNGADSCVSPAYFQATPGPMIRVPSEIANAERGDVLLTAGGSVASPIPAMFRSLGMIYTHAMFISETRNEDGTTTVSHQTGTEPGANLIRKSVDRALFPIPFLTGVLDINAIWDARAIARLVPGNVISDPIDDLINSVEPHCLSSRDPVTGDKNLPIDCMHSRPRLVFKNSSILLKAKEPEGRTRALDAVARMESKVPGSILYSFGSFSKQTDAWGGLNGESSFGPGAHCSGNICQEFNDQGMGLTLASMSAEQRNIAAQEFYSTVQPRIKEKLRAGAQGTNGQWHSVLRPITGLLLGVDYAARPARQLTNQLLNCFMFGGACADTSRTWRNNTTSGLATASDHLIPSRYNYASGVGHTQFVHFSASGNTPAINQTVQLSEGIQRDWATLENARWIGGYWTRGRSTYQCCVDTNAGSFCVPAGSGGAGAAVPYLQSF